MPARRLCLPKLVPSLQHEWPAYDFLDPFVDEIATFQRKVHSRVLDPLLRLFALLLELPEDYFAKVSGAFPRL
jgi:isopenicillin N synthase-like dioxygenase